ncbi:MAG TPA: EAL domain-containing protein [Candidatus Macondimonas sp.]|nr:EAL domain-containing protein [Candidatus Macondimonas sp.]
MNTESPDFISAWVVDHSPNSTDVVGSLLRNAGLRVRTRHIADLTALNDALRDDRPDVLLCPEVNGSVPLPDVIARARTCDPPLPVIAGGERPDTTRIAQTIRQGAAMLIDFQAGDLLAAVTLRELERAETLRRHVANSEQADLWRSQCERFVAQTSDPIVSVVEGIHVKVNAAYARLMGFAGPEDVEGCPIMDLIAPASRDAVKRCLREAQQGRLPAQPFDVIGVRRDGSRIDMTWHCGWTQSGDQRVLQIMMPARAVDPEMAELLETTRIQCEQQQGTIRDLNRELETLRADLAGTRQALEKLQGERAAAPTSSLERLRQDLHLLTAAPLPDRGSRFLMIIHLEELAGLLPAVGYIACEAALAHYTTAAAALLPPGHALIRLRDFSLAAVVHESSIEQLKSRAAAWQAALGEEVITVGPQSRVLRAIIGIREWPSGDATTVEAALLDAERAVQDARGTRQVIGVARPARLETNTAQADAAWESRIRSALAHDRLQLVYQPVSSFSANVAEYYEVRLRLLDEDGSEQSPLLFWPAAERTGIAEALDHWVFTRAITVLSERRQEGSETGFFVKVSGASLQSPAGVEWFRSHLPGPHLKLPLYLQISEEHIESNLKNVLALTQTLKQNGHALVVDHFGKSRHALQLASHLSPRFFKLAPDLLKEVTESQEAQTYIRQIVDYAERHEIGVIAGHVESAHTLAMLWQLGVHYLQGHYLQEPEVVLHSPERRSGPPPQQERRA